MNEADVPRHQAPWRRWFWRVGIAVFLVGGVYVGVRYDDHVEHTVEGAIMLAAALAYAWLSHRERPDEVTRRSDLGMVALIGVMALCSFIRATPLAENTKLAICFAVLLVVGVAVVLDGRPPRRTRK